MKWNFFKNKRKEPKQTLNFEKLTDKEQKNIHGAAAYLANEHLYETIPVIHKTNSYL